MNLDQLEAFLYVVELKSVHKAAQALYLSQPTITARIKTLEAELETELFIRNNRQLMINEQGKAFIPYAQQMLQSFQQAKKMLHKSDDKRTITIGANVITSQYFMPYVLPEWAKLLQDFQLQFVNGTNELLLKKVKEEEVDFAFMRATTDKAVTQIPVIDNTVKLVVHPLHPLAKLERVTMQRLATEPFVFFECGAFDWNLIYKLFEVEQIEPSIDLITDHLQVAKSFIETNHCIGFLPYLAVREQLLDGRLIEVDTSHFLSIQQHIYLTYKKSSSLYFLKDAILQSAQTFMQQGNKNVNQ